MLELKNVTKNYKLNNGIVTALKGINITFRKSEFVSILGASGCGKTTLLNIVGGLDRYTNGDLLINGRSTKEYKDSDWDFYRNKTIGFVFQSYNLISHLSVLKNVEIALTLAGISKSERKQRAIEALKKVDLASQIHKKPNQLSGGQMQRVAIARALINNPQIILADEPTGALDSESGLQVMELLSKVAEDRLVIMVTHNSDLATKYSTRIVKLSDGEIIDDSMPYAYEPPLIVNSCNVPKKLIKNKVKNKVSMSPFTALSLSFHNLMSKKGRTFLTAFAGSIGIIGIALILALSVGVSSFIAGTERSSLSVYPIIVGKNNISLDSLTSMLSYQATELEEYPDSEEITTRKVIGGVLNNLAGMFTTNDLEAVKSYLDEGFDEDWGYIKYDYSAQFNIYCDYLGEEDYIKINPYTDSLKDSLKEIVKSFESYINMLSLWDELINNEVILHQQYELLGNSKWPTSKEEVIIVIDQYNQLSDYALFGLGLLSPNDLLKAMAGSEIATSRKFSVDELLSLQYRIMANSDYYHFDEDSSVWQKESFARSDKAFVDANSLNLKVVGVVRPKKGSSVSSITGVIGYTHELTEYIINKAKDSEVVNAQIESPKKNIITNATIKTDEYQAILAEMGLADLSKPSMIRIYANSFAKKELITDYLDSHKELKGKRITYTDTLGLLMSYINTVTKTVTYVLIGFSSISLIVSSIMIAIIIYTSVLERRKEIGILRSIGAKKIDITNVFLAESGIIGLSSGILGMLVTILIAVPANLILKSVLSVGGLVTVVWWHALILVGLSVVLSMISGFIPSRIAAKKDPVSALRTE